MNNLIGISGKIGAGKDTVGKIIQYIAANYEVHEIVKYFNRDSLKENPSTYEIKKFADKLKDIVCLLIGCTREQLEDREFKEKELGKEWWYYSVNNSLHPYVGLKAEDNISQHGLLVKLTPRKLLQLLGTKAGRQIIHPNIWVNALFADYFPKKEKIKYKKVTYLPTRYDRLDEYYQLESGVSKEDFLLFLKPIIGNTKTFKDFNPSEFSVDRITKGKVKSLYDVVGGFFGKMGYYRQSFYNDWLPKDLQATLINDNNLCERRFKWVVEELKAYPDYKEEQYPNWVITDVRFPNEVEAIKDRSGIMIRINRPETDSNAGTHLSETALDDYQDWDIVINNNGTIEDLIQKIKQLKIV